MFLYNLWIKLFHLVYRGSQEWNPCVIWQGLPVQTTDNRNILIKRVYSLRSEKSSHVQDICCHLFLILFNPICLDLFKHMVQNIYNVFSTLVAHVEETNIRNQNKLSSLLR